jgi:hypothetical protein
MSFVNIQGAWRIKGLDTGAHRGQRDQLCCPWRLRVQHKAGGAGVNEADIPL